MTAVRFRDVSKVYHHYRRPSDRFREILWPGRQLHESLAALKDASFEIAPGSTVGLIGENGSGKSTALMLMNRTLTPSSGSVEILGRTAALLELGAGFNMQFTGRENIFLMGGLMGIPQAEMRKNVERIAEFAGIGRALERSVATYSSGMVVRLAFSIMSHVDPEILLVDEALAVGDQEFQEKSVAKIKEFRAAGKTIVVVSHAIGTIRTLCERAIWLQEGRVRQDGDVFTVTNAYEDFMRAKLGASRLKPRPEAGPAGSRKLVILDSRVTDLEGRERGRFETGEGIVVEVRYRALERVVEPMIGVAITRNDGVSVTQTGTLADMAGPEYLEGDGLFRAVFPELPLLNGVYDVGINIADKQVLLTYDSVFGRHQIQMVCPRNARGHDVNWGLVLIPHRWEFESLEGRPEPSEGADADPR